MTVVPLVRLICCHVCGERGELRADGRGLYAPQGWYRLTPTKFACSKEHALAAVRRALEMPER